MGSWLHSQGLVPDYTVASPALRARQTALAAGAAWDLDASAVQWREGVYNADLATLLGVLADAHPTAATTLLVGHNPGLSDLVNHLDRPEYAHGRISLQPGAAAILELPNGWSKLAPGCGRLVLVQQPATTP